MPNPTDEIRLLLDENISPNIVPRLWEAGIDALPVMHRAMTGSPDHVVFQFAQKESRAVATIDQHDFRKLAQKKASHCGVAIIPSGGTRDEQYEYLMELASFLRAIPPPMEALRNRLLSVDAEMQIAFETVCTSPIDLPIVATAVRLKPIA